MALSFKSSDFDPVEDKEEIQAMLARNNGKGLTEKELAAAREEEILRHRTEVIQWGADQEVAAAEINLYLMCYLLEIPPVTMIL
jgi:hypothetical protein